MIITGCAIELAHSVLSRAMIITRPAHKISKYAADFRGQLVASCYDHTLPVNISAEYVANSCLDPTAASLTIISVFLYISFMVVVNRTCVGTYVEKDSKCDIATESRSMSDISRTQDTYVMRYSRMIYKYHFLAQYKELRPPL
jgi:hypothetical protein